MTQKDVNDDSIYEWNKSKREKTLQERGLDFKNASKIFEAKNQAELVDDRKDYGEESIITTALIDDKLIVMVWTPRGQKKRIISMRYGHEKEREFWKKRMGG